MSADALFDWLVDGAPGVTRSEDIAERIGSELGAAGIPLDRLHVFVTTLHPTVLGRQFRWSPGKPVETVPLTLAIQQSAPFANSPLARIVKTREEIRRRLDAPLEPSDYGIFHDLRADGFTDYFCAPLVFSSGETHAVTFATRAPGGFREEHLATLRRISRPLSRVAEIYALRRVATNLLSTYVGRNSGERILAGRIRRGDIETIRAVIWFSDLRGFTEMSSRSSPPEIVAVLNELFDFQVPAVQAHGGEVLKFIGDGMLAIFPFDADPTKSCRDALAASREAFAALDRFNSRRSAFGGPVDRNAKAASPIRFGLALHLGEIAYGNIGGDARLDFTAIGPAVNVASRLEGIAGKLGQRVVVSADVAAHLDVPLDDLGEHSLKGVPAPQRVFAPREEES